jgi:N-acetylglucosaminyldiphosphoundecaprenol N-acetyl-beta-D-mannosaminyltransferase
VLGIPVHQVTIADALVTIEEFIRERRPHLVVTADACGLVLARGDAALHDLLLAADLVTPDSAGVVWAMRRKGAHIPDRVSGCDLTAELCRLSAEKGYRIYLVGAAEGVAGRAADRLRARYAGCQIVGTDSGYFTEAEEESILQRIHEASPDVLLVAMGMPKQEKWIVAHMQSLRVPVSIGVGGTLDVYAGLIRRAPRAVQRMSMEWLWRLLQNPRKMRKVIVLPKFVCMVLREE